MTRDQARVGVLFVCMGNICRSPTAHGVFRSRVAAAGLQDRIAIDSAGTHGYHVGSAPDARAVAAAARRGYDLSDLRARRVGAADLERFDHVLAMDRANLGALGSLAAGAAATAPRLLLVHAATDTDEVPDPYYGADHEFERVLDLVEAGCDGLLAELCRRHGWRG
ncbi:MAG: low molecular weight protein-tyrosine-phosphatase [Halofilum sp. (in: g-proteobacteria)]|nr:low molecular weight protein-tyrosine-phosphatase [Halofilum sp. (in: g-proteobacteria)]